MDPVLVNGELTRPLRTEAEARAARRKFYAGERFEQAERRWFREHRQRFDLAIASAISALEDANINPDQIKDFRAITSDFTSDTWAVDARAEEEATR